MSIKTYKDIKVWQKGIALIKDIYLLSAELPDSEKYNLQSQMRRAAVSIPCNIAEGYGRNSNKDFQRFLFIALGSIFELQTQISISFELAYFNEEYFNKNYEKTREIERILCSFIESNKDFIDK